MNMGNEKITISRKEFRRRVQEQLRALLLTSRKK